MGDILQARIRKSTQTISLMDKFESRNEDHQKIYDTLELIDLFLVNYRNHYYKVSLSVQRKPRDLKCIESSLTFTDLKKELLDKWFYLKDKDSFKIVHEVYEGLKKVWNSKDKTVSYPLPTPVMFNAQNSGNRCGYGNIYYGEDLICEGTLYGETTDYMFVEVKYRRWC